MRISKYILSSLLLIAALAWTVWFVFAGFGNPQDPLYWLYKYTQLEGGWMAVGTLLSGGGIVRIFGPELLPLRLAGWLCVVGAIALPYCCLLTKEQRRENVHWLALAYLLMGYGAFQEFSPGTLSVLLLSLLWVCVEWYRRSENGMAAVICAGIVTGLAVAVRFPNIIAFPIALWALHNGKQIIAHHETHSRLALTIAAAVTAGIVYGLSLWLITPAAADAAMSSHEVRAMCLKLWTQGGKLIGYLFIALGALAIGKKGMRGLRDERIRGLGVGLVLVYFVGYTMRSTQWYNTDLTYFISALCLVIAACTALRSDENPSPVLSGIVLLAVATLGTDTAWLKLFPAVLCLLPVAGVQYKQPMRRYLWPLLMVLSVIVVIRFTTNSVGKTDLIEADTQASVAPYEHIAITAAEQERLLQIKADYDSLRLADEGIRGLTDEGIRELEVLAVGQENHLVRAVTGCEAARYNEFWSNIFDSVYTAKYRSIIEEERPVVFCSFSPQFKTKATYKDRQSAFETMLREQGYREIDRSEYRYMIYVPDEGISGLED